MASVPESGSDQSGERPKMTERWRDVTNQVIAKQRALRPLVTAPGVTRVRRNLVDPSAIGGGDGVRLLLPTINSEDEEGVRVGAETDQSSWRPPGSPHAPRKQVLTTLRITSHGMRVTMSPPASPSGASHPFDEQGEGGEGGGEEAGWSVRRQSIQSDADGEDSTGVHERSTFNLFGSVYDLFVDKMLRSYWKTAGKKINANEDVLRTYHESWLYGKVPFNTRVRAHLRVGPIATARLIMECLCSFTSIVFYARSTYGLPNNKVIQVLQLIFSCFYLTDYVLKVYSAAVRVYYILSFDGIVDLLSMFPANLFRSGSMLGQIGGIPQLLLCFRILRIAAKLLTHILVGNTVWQQISLLLTYTFGAVFFAAGLYQWVENKAATGDLYCPNKDGETCINYFESFYFVIVTMATVGYGDFSPNTYWGRTIVILLIIAAIVFFPAQIGKILDIAARRPYGGSFDTKKIVGSRFIIMSGNLTLRTVQTFLSEFYHPVHDHDLASYPLRVVIMAPFKPSFELKTLLSLYDGMVEFIEGSPVKSSDLDRVSARAASAFFILADQHAVDADREDASQIVRALSVHRYCGSRVRVIVEMLKPESETSAIWDDTEQSIEVICPDETRFNMLASSCTVRGLTTFISNLFKSGAVPTEKALERATKRDPWMAEYYFGYLQEVCPVLLPPLFHGHRFEEVAEFVYRSCGSILFALDVKLWDNETGKDTTRGILLFPRGHIITEPDVGLIIARDLRTAERVSKYVDPGKSRSCFLHRSQKGQDLPQHLNKLVCGCVPRTPSVLPSTKKHQQWAKARELMREIHESWDTNVSGFEQLTLSGLKDLSTSSSFTGDKREALDASDTSPGGSRGRNRRRSSKAQLLISRNRPSEDELKGHLEKVLLSSGERKPKNAAVSLMPSPSPASMTPTCLHELRSLEDAVEKLLEWPSKLSLGKPHPAVLERQQETILQNLKDRTLMVANLPSPHILVCMQGEWPVNLYHFVWHLRRPGRSKLPIVALHPLTPTAAQWGCVGLFESVYFVKGSPIYEIDLLRAGILSAEKVVVLSNGGTGEDADADADGGFVKPLSSYRGDIENVVVAANVERLLQTEKRRLLVEMQHEDAFQYLRPKYSLAGRKQKWRVQGRDQSVQWLLYPPFQQGKAFCPSIMNFLLYGTFYNRNLVEIVEQLVNGGPLEDIPEATDESEGEDPQMALRELKQVEVPERFVGDTFGNLFVGMLHREHMLALGLYRACGTKGSPTGYVYTNPQSDTQCGANDLVYVLR